MAIFNIDFYKLSDKIFIYLNSKDFIRVKLGIGRPKRGAAERYVLKPFNKQERPVMEEAVETAANAIEIILSKGVTYAQNKYHSKVT